jgi:hypothetical protein
MAGPRASQPNGLAIRRIVDEPAPGGALLVKLQPEATPILASPDADLPIHVPSHLYLGVNGWQSHGTIPARVHVEWHKPEQTGPSTH